MTTSSLEQLFLEPIILWPTQLLKVSTMLNQNPTRYTVAELGILAWGGQMMVFINWFK